MTNDTTRRGFLGTAAGIAGASLAGAVPASAKVEPAPWGIKLGVATYSLRKFDRTKAIEMIKALQTPWVSIKEFHLRYASTPEELAAGVYACSPVGERFACTFEYLEYRPCTWPAHG